MDRPTMKRLLANVKEGTIDVVDVYKVDRLTRSLADMRHKDQWYEGKYPAIIDQQLWDDVHSILATNGHKRGNNTLTITTSLLEDIAFTEDGKALTTRSTAKKERPLVSILYEHSRE